MKILMIGGTGTISAAVSRKIIANGDELYLLNRGNHVLEGLENATVLCGDIFNEEEVGKLLEPYAFDVVVEFLAFTVEHMKKDVRLFKGKTKQYVFISSASAYKKPIEFYPITEEHPLGNPYWEYSRNKQYCEEYILSEQSTDFNVTVVRPSHTYDERKVVQVFKDYAAPLTTIKRILDGKKMIIPGDGTSLWTLTFNKDFAEFFVPLLGNKEAFGETYQITSDFVYTWEQLNEMICKELGVKPNIVHIPTDFIIKHVPYLEGELLGDKSWSAVFDNTKIKAIANYQAVTRYEEILPMALQRLLNDPQNQQINEEYDQLIDKIIFEYEKR